ncbi:hypothetical protein SNEBB_009675 [Seison nebaliae]|nr:hypothetical protein SNEBB_009675 [Seison nebaliae]
MEWSLSILDVIIIGLFVLQKIYIYLINLYDMREIAIVTGATRGIGLAIAKLLAKQYDGTVYITGRNLENLKEVQNEIGNVEIFLLDINNTEHHKNLKKFITKNYLKTEILINNAGIMLDEIPKTTLDTFLKEGCSVVNIASQFGHIGRIPSIEARRAFTKANRTLEDIHNVLQHYLKSIKEGIDLEQWPKNSYDVSKCAFISATNVLAENMMGNIYMNSCCPGYVNTDLTKGKGILTTEEGAKTPIFLAFMHRNPKKWKGEFVVNCKRKVWKKEHLL